jgi:hypothetical protein
MSGRLERDSIRVLLCRNAIRTRSRQSDTRAFGSPRRGGGSVGMRRARPASHCLHMAGAGGEPCRGQDHAGLLGQEAVGRLETGKRGVPANCSSTESLSRAPRVILADESARSTAAANRPVIRKGQACDSATGAGSVALRFESCNTTLFRVGGTLTA